MDPAPSFVHRRSGIAATHLGSGVPRIEEALRVSLEAHDGRVLVNSVQRQPDGTFIGKVYGIKPGQRSVAVGDIVHFEELQIFTFRTAEDPSRRSIEAEVADMVRRFQERFAELQPQPSRQSNDRDSVIAADLIRFDSAATEDRHASADAGQPSSDLSPAIRLAKSDETREEGSIDQALSVRESAEKRAFELPSERIEPFVASEASPAAMSVVTESSLRCVECGTTLIVVPSPQGATPEPHNVTCPVCGRINKLAEAQAARRRLHP